MQVDIVVNGRKVGVATINVDISEQLKDRHEVTEKSVIDAIRSMKAQEWYCMGDVQVIPKVQAEIRPERSAYSNSFEM